MMDSLVQDLRLGVRALLKDRWFTAAAAAVLALGIAATATVFTLVNGILLRDLPFPDPDRIVDMGGVSYADLLDWSAGLRTFEGVAAAGERYMNVSDPDVPPERLRGAFVSANAFDVLGIRPTHGRGFQPDDDRPGATPVVILGEHAWRTRYASDAGIIGRTIRVNGTPAVVVGVMPEGFEFPANARIWLPAALMPAPERADRSRRSLQAFGRLMPGVTPAQAREDVAVVAGRLAREYPDEARDVRPAVAPFRSGIGGPVVAMLAAMMGSVVFVLLIACANVANLMLARAVRRTREVSLRMSIGASRGRIVRQLLVEHLLLAGVAGAAALAVTAVSIRIFWQVVSSVPDPPPFWLRFPVDLSVFAFLAAICLGTSVLFGMVPALHASKTNVMEVLNEAGRGSTAHRRSSRWAGALVVGQLALALVLLAGAGLMMRNLVGLVRLDAGVDTASLVRMGLDLPADAYPSAERRQAFYMELTERLSETTDMRAALASAMPLDAAAQGALVLDDGADLPPDRRPVASVVGVGPGYFDTVGAPMLAGRAFARDDGTAARPAAIVNRRFADLFLAGGDPVGRRIRLGDAPDWIPIVGMVTDIRQRTTQSGASDPVVYVPIAANPPARAVILARGGAGAPDVAVVRREVGALDADLALYDVRTVDEHLAMRRWGQRVFGSMFAIFAGIALVLAMVGLYAVTSYSVAQRTPEIGIRIALGAQSRQVWWLVTRRVSLQLGLGLLLGTAGAAAATRAVPAMLAGSGGGAPSTIAGMAIALLLTGLAACFIPARRAMRVDPIAALRAD